MAGIFCFTIKAAPRGILGVIVMTRENTERFVDFLSFLKECRPVPLFSWEIMVGNLLVDEYSIRVHVINHTFVHEVLDLISGISGVTFFNWSCESSENYALDIILY